MKIIWTAVPAGFVKAPGGDRLKVSVAITFKPEIDNSSSAAAKQAETGAIRTLLADWPAFVRSVPLIIRLDNAAVKTTRLDRNLGSREADSEIWQRLVWGKGRGLPGPELAHVNVGKSFGPEATAVTESPAGEVHRTMRDLTTLGLAAQLESIEAAFSGKSGGSVAARAVTGASSHLLDELQALRLRRADAARVEVPATREALQRHETWRNHLKMRKAELDVIGGEPTRRIERNLYRLSPEGAKGLLPHVVELVKALSGLKPGEIAEARRASDNRALMALLQLAVFHCRVPPTLATVSPAPDKEALDPARVLDVFERMTLLRNYPALLRPLGLVVDVACEVPTGATAPQVVMVATPAGPAGVQIQMVSPTTAVEFSRQGNVFRARPRGNPDAIANGFLNLEDSSQFSIITSDTDGHGLKMLAAVNEITGSTGLVVTTGCDQPLKILATNSLGERIGIQPGEDLAACFGRFKASPEEVELFKSELLRFSQDDPKAPLDPCVAWSSAIFKLSMTFSYKNDAREDQTVSTKAVWARPIRQGTALKRLWWQLLDATPAYGEPPEPALPSARSGGVSLVWQGRGQRVYQSLSRPGAINNPAKGPDESRVYADDLILGYVPDLWVPAPNRGGKGRWFPLTIRREVFVDAPALNGCREGVLRAAVAKTLDQKYDATAPDYRDIHVGEILFTWEGWSLGTNRLEPPDVMVQDIAQNVASFCQALARKTSRAADYVWRRLSGHTRELLGSPAAALEGLRNDLTRMVHGPLIWNQDRLKGVVLSDETNCLLKCWLGEGRHGAYATAWLNRMLIEDIFPDCVAKRRGKSPAAVLNDAQAQNLNHEESARWNLRMMLEAEDNSIIPLRFWSGQVEGASAAPGWRMRVRITDVAGNTTPAGMDDVREGPSQAVDYRRHESIAAPELLLDRSPREDGPVKRGLTRMVIRANQDRDVRWIVPPRTSEQMAELHGCLEVDDLDDVGSFSDCLLDENGDFPLVSKSDALEAKAGPPAADKNPADCYPIRLPGSSCDRPAIPYYPDPLALGLSWSIEFLEAQKDCPVVYRVSAPQIIPFYSGRKWPRARAVRLSLESTSDSEPSGSWRGGTGTLVVRVPPGMTARLHLRCAPKAHDGEQDRLETFAFFAEHAAFCRQKSVRARLSQGCVDLVCAPRMVELLHASRSPLEAPVIQAVHYLDHGKRQHRYPVDSSQGLSGIGRLENDLSALLSFHVLAEIQSTAKVRITAQWDGPDTANPSSDGSKRLHGNAILGEVQAADWIAGPGLVPLPRMHLRHSLPSTGFHLVTYRAVASSRFKEHYSDEKDPSKFEGESPPARVPFLNCAVPPAPAFAYLVPTFEWRQEPITCPDPITGQKGVRQFRSQRLGWVRLFFSGAWNVTGDDEMIGVLLWGGEARPEEASRMRRSATCWGLDPIRSFAANPSFGPSSFGPRRSDLEGYVMFTPGEIADLPGVISRLRAADLHSREFANRLDLSPATRRRVQAYRGQEDFELRRMLAEDFDRAIRLGGVSGRTLTERRETLRSEFARTNPKTNQSDFALLPEHLFDVSNSDFRRLPLPKAADGVYVVPYQPQYDAERQLWYCDIRVNSLPAEYTFLRLAIGRFQPHSTDGCHLSEAVLADFAQLAPDRMLVVWRDPAVASGKVLRVQVHGTVPSADSTIEMDVYRQDDEGGWIPDKEIGWADDASLGHGALRSGSLTWKQRTGPRRLFVRELPVGDLRPDASECRSFPYMDILDL